MNQFFQNLFSENECIEVVKSLRWGDMVLCPFCNYHNVYKLKKHEYYKCSKCKGEFNCKSGTVFEGSRLVLSSWFVLLYLVCYNKKLTSVKISEVLGITQKSAWNMLSKIKGFKDFKDRRLVNDIKVWIKNRESKKAKPFIQWAGSKRGLIQELVCRLPREFENYYEPFIGGGSLFFEVWDKIKGSCFISDVNSELVACYEVIRDNLEDLLEVLELHKIKYFEDSRGYYEFIRDRYICSDKIEIVARFLFLNRTCFNALYKTNSSGKFIGAFANYDNPNFPTKESLELCNKVLSNDRVIISHNDFSIIKPQSKDFVYFDPPYFYYNERDGYISYVGSKILTKDFQIQLRDFALELVNNGVYVMLSNSNTPFIRELYNHDYWKIDSIKVLRNISHVGRNRGFESEVIVRSY